jgi:hypothetical protein
MMRELWGAVDDYIVAHLIASDDALNAAPAASENAGLPPGGSPDARCAAGP